MHAVKKCYLFCTVIIYIFFPFFLYIFPNNGTALFGQNNDFRGTVETISYYTEYNKNYERKPENAKKAIRLIEYANDTLWSYFTICGDTLIEENFRMVISDKGENGVERIMDFKIVQIGKTRYIKGKNNYFKFNMQPDLATFEENDWKHIEQKNGDGGGYTYTATDKKNRDYKYYIIVDTSARYVRQLSLKAVFPRIFNPFGTYERILRVSPKGKFEMHFKYKPEINCDCNVKMEDFISVDTNELTLDFLEHKYSNKIIPPENRKALPFFEARTDGGLIYFNSDLKGKLIYIDVWASWCQPCRRQMPFLREINTKYAHQGLQIVSISLDEIGTERGARWKEVSGELNINWLNLLLEGGFGSGFCKDLDISTIPRYILVDAEGKILNDNAPPPADKHLEELLDVLLRK